MWRESKTMNIMGEPLWKVCKKAYELSVGEPVMLYQRDWDKNVIVETEGLVIGKRWDRNGNMYALIANDYAVFQHHDMQKWEFTCVRPASPNPVDWKNNWGQCRKVAAEFWQEEKAKLEKETRLYETKLWK